MTKKTITRFLMLLLGMSVFISDAVMGSAKNRSLTYIFTAEGRLARIEGVKNDYPLLTLNNPITFKIVDYNNTLKARFQPMFYKYLNAYKYLQKKENQAILTYYFGFRTTEIDSLNMEYLSNVIFLNDKFKYAENLKLLGVENTNNNLIIQGDDAKKFKEEIYDKLFTIIIHLPELVKPITVTFNECGTLTEDQIREIIQLPENNAPDGLNYELRFTPPESRYIQNNLKVIRDLMPDSNEFNTIVKLFKETSLKLKEIDSVAASLHQPSCAQIKEVIDSLDSIRKNNYEKIFNYLKKQKNWVKLFLWYTEGVPSLTPFEPDPGKSQDQKAKDSIKESRKKTIKNLIAINDTIKSIQNNELLALTEKKNAIKSILSANHNGCDACIEHIPGTLYILEKQLNIIKQKIQQLTDLNLNLEKESKDIAASDTGKRNQQKVLLIKDEFLYSGKMIVNFGRTCRKSGNIYVREHNAEDFYRPMNSMKDNYDENAKIRVLIENTTKNAKITFTTTPIKDISIVEQLVGPGLVNLSSFAKDALTQVQALKGTEADTCKVIIRPGLLDSINNDIVFFKKILKYHEGFDYYQTPSVFPSKHTQDTIGKKLFNYISSYKVSYQIKLGNLADSFEYRINKLYLIWPTAGLVYSFAKEPEVTINTDGTLSTKYFSGMHLLAGLKIHPWRTSIMDPYFVISGKRRPFFDYRKLYIVLGADVLNITRIYYIGTGIDLWSGISLTAGSQLIVKKQQKFENGIVRSKDYLDWRNLYVGINIDLTLAIKMVQFFAFK